MVALSAPPAHPGELLSKMKSEKKTIFRESCTGPGPEAGYANQSASALLDVSKKLLNSAQPRVWFGLQTDEANLALV